MDLLTIGWTARASDYDTAAVMAVLNTITMDWIKDQAEVLDPSGGYELADLHEMLLTGAEDYQGHMQGTHRYGTVYDVPTGDDLLFYIAGGGSYGDDPYDDWSALGMFVNACEARPELAAAAGFFGGGIVL
jgi:hypothetical protein